MGTPVATRHRFLWWLLIDGNRLLVAGLTLLVLFGIALVVDPIRTVTGESSTLLFYMFSALLGGNLNLLTIVVAVNQLVFSREVQSTGELRSEIANVSELRGSVAESVGREVAPVTPAGFLQALLDALAQHLQTLAAAVEQGRDDGLDSSLDDTASLVRRLDAQLDSVEDRLTDTPAKTVDVLGATLAIDFSETNHLACRIRERDGDRLAAQTRTALDGVVTRLEQLVLVRNHFESMYTQENLAQMSRQLLFVGVPVEFLLGFTLVWFVGLLSPAAPAALPAVVVYLLLVLGLAPLAVVFAFVVRAVTIARQTAITTQFTPQRRAESVRKERMLAEEES